MSSLSIKEKERFGLAIFWISIIVFGLIGTSEGFAIAHVGGRMADIRSVSGDSIAEAYYQLHGKIYGSIGRIIAYTNLGICCMGVIYSSFIRKTCKKELIAIQRNTETGEVKNTNLFGEHKDKVCSD